MIPVGSFFLHRGCTLHCEIMLVKVADLKAET